MNLYQDYGDIAEKLLGYVETKTTDLADDVYRVSVAKYLDEGQWKQEIEKIFKRLPLMLALTIELPEAGDYKAMDVIGLPILLTRSKDGQARAFLNVCKHRGMHLAAEGRGCRNRFSCPYHGWTYANDGTLIGIAEADTYGEVDKASLNLTQLPCQEVAGMIFVVLTPGAPIDAPTFLGGMLQDLAALKLETWYYHKARELVGANWKVAYDGYLEGYHFQAAHGETVATRTPSNRAHYTGFGPHLRIGFPQHRITQLHDLPREQWGHQENDGFDFVRVLFPNFSFFLAPEMCQFAQLLPGATAGTSRTILNYISPKAPANEAETKALDDMCDFFYEVVRDEDYALGLKVQNGLESGAMKDVVFGRNERGNQYFHKWVDYYLAEPGTMAKPSL